MNEDATIEPAIAAPVPPAPPPVVVPERAEPILGSLASARAITLRHLQRIDRVAEEMAPDDLKVALAEDGQMTLNLTRADRALRQICAMELEIMGLREPPVPRGPAAGRNGSGGNRTGRNDFNDLNDLNDMQDIEDLEALEALYDFDDPEDVGHYDDLDALEEYDTYEEYESKRPHRGELSDADEDAMEQEIDAIIAGIDWSKVPPIADEDRYQNMKDYEAELKADLAADIAKLEAIWRDRRAALLNLRAPQNRLRRKSRGPPGG